MTWYCGNLEDDAYLSGLVDAVGTHYVDTESRNRGTGFFSSRSGESAEQTVGESPSVEDGRTMATLEGIEYRVSIDGLSAP